MLLIAAAMLFAPSPVRANTLEIIRPKAVYQAPGATDVPRSGSLLAQNLAAPANIAGTYSGRVDRRSVRGEPQATRTYRLTMNPDTNTGKLFIHDLDGTLRSEIGLVGKMIDDRTFEGTTTVIDASPNYRPDHVRLVFSPDRGSVEWYHNDGTIEGSGTLSRSVADEEPTR
jgi:hypothetical protein